VPILLGPVGAGRDTAVTWWRRKGRERHSKLRRGFRIIVIELMGGERYNDKISY